MLSLVIKLLGDQSPFRKATEDAKKTAAKGGSDVGKEFANQFKSGMMRFLSAGAIISALQKAMADAVRIEGGALRMDISPEAFQELSKAAEMLGMSVDELKQMAPEAAAEFEALMQSIRENGGILDAETVALLSDTSDAMGRLWAQMQPALGMFVKSVSWVTGQGQKWLTVASGSAMDIAGRMTGDASLKQAGIDLQREGMAQEVPFGSSALSSATRQSGRRFVGAVNENRGLVAARGAYLADTFGSAKSGSETALPLVGGVLSQLVDAMQKNADQVRQQTEALNKKL